MSFDNRFEHEFFILDGHGFYFREDGIVVDADGHMIGNLTESPCGEYRIFEDDDGDAIGYCHENEMAEIDLIKATIPTIAGW